MRRVNIYVVPQATSWRVKASGMVWDIASREDAIAFADAMARKYADATLDAACVRVQEATGMHVLARYGGERDAGVPLS